MVLGVLIVDQAELLVHFIRRDFFLQLWHNINHNCDGAVLLDFYDVARAPRAITSTDLRIVTNSISMAVGSCTTDAVPLRGNRYKLGIRRYVGPLAEELFNDVLLRLLR